MWNHQKRLRVAIASCIVRNKVGRAKRPQASTNISKAKRHSQWQAEACTPKENRDVSHEFHGERTGKFDSMGIYGLNCEGIGLIPLLFLCAFESLWFVLNVPAEPVKFSWDR